MLFLSNNELYTVFIFDGSLILFSNKFKQLKKGTGFRKEQITNTIKLLNVILFYFDWFIG